MTGAGRLLSAPDADWRPVTTGESGATVHISADGSRYRKAVPADRAGELAEERDRIGWLAGQGLPGARVLEWVSDGSGACLTTSAVPGVPADRLTAADLRAAWPRIAAAVRELHGLPAAAAAEAGFERGLDRMLRLARDVVGRGAVNPSFLPPEQQGVPYGELLSRVLADVPRMRELEATDGVVCHGDLCLPNIMLDPASLTVTGFIDLGRLGVGDRHADLSLLMANSRDETWPDEATAHEAEAAFADSYGRTPDPERLRFYLHLDPLTWG